MTRPAITRADLVDGIVEAICAKLRTSDSTWCYHLEDIEETLLNAFDLISGLHHLDIQAAFINRAIAERQVIHDPSALQAHLRSKP